MLAYQQLQVDVYSISNVSRQSVIQEWFLQHRGFSLAFGCVDGSNIAITVLVSNEELYIYRGCFIYEYLEFLSRISFHSSVFMWPGSIHDAFIWRQSIVKGKHIKFSYTNWRLLGDTATFKTIECSFVFGKVVGAQWTCLSTTTTHTPDNLLSVYTFQSIIRRAHKDLHSSVQIIWIYSWRNLGNFEVADYLVIR